MAGDHSTCILLVFLLLSNSDCTGRSIAEKLEAPTKSVMLTYPGPLPLRQSNTHKDNDHRKTVPVKGRSRSRSRLNADSSYTLVDMLITVTLALIVMSMNAVETLAIFFGVFVLASLMLSMIILMKRHSLGLSGHFGRKSKGPGIETGSYHALDPELQTAHDYRFLESRVQQGATDTGSRASNTYEEIPLSSRHVPDTGSLGTRALRPPPSSHTTPCLLTPFHLSTGHLPSTSTMQMDIPSPYFAEDLPPLPLPPRNTSTLPRASMNLPPPTTTVGIVR